MEMHSLLVKKTARGPPCHPVTLEVCIYLYCDASFISHNYIDDSHSPEYEMKEQYTDYHT